MANKATDHKFTYATTRAVKVRKGPGIGNEQTGSVEARVEVYADEMPKPGTDGRPWLLTTIGYICSDYLELKYDHTTDPRPVPPPLTIDKARIISSAQSIRDYADKIIELASKL